jgi:hypothetical protein
MLACLQSCDAAGGHARAPGPVDCAPQPVAVSGAVDVARVSGSALLKTCR